MFRVRTRVLFWVAVCVVALAPSALAAEQVPAEQEAKPSAVVRNEMRVLSASEVDRYVAALGELAHLGLDAAAQLEGEPSALRQRATALQYGAEMQEVLARHDFDPQSFTEVHWNVLSAYLALELAQPSAELQQAQAQQQQLLAEMKKQLPPEQYEAAARAMQELIPALAAVTGAPEANRVLVAERREALDAVFKSATEAPE